MQNLAKKQVLVVDDHPMFRHGITSILGGESDLELCGEASNVGEALEAARRNKPDIALIDISMPGANGIELIKALRAEHPHIRMLSMSMHEESLYALRAIRAGALGYVMKDSPYETMLEAIHCVRDGRLFLSRELLDRLLIFAIQNFDAESPPDLESLSTRELEVLALYGKGLGTREICDRVKVGTKTVETYRNRIRQKLGLVDLPHLLRFAGDWVKLNVQRS